MASSNVVRNLLIGGALTGTVAWGGTLMVQQNAETIREFVGNMNQELGDMLGNFDVFRTDAERQIIALLEEIAELERQAEEDGAENDANIAELLAEIARLEGEVNQANADMTALNEAVEALLGEAREDYEEFNYTLDEFDFEGFDIDAMREEISGN